MSIPNSSAVAGDLVRQKVSWRERIIQWAPVLLVVFVFAMFARTLTFGLYLDDNHFVRSWSLTEVLGAFAGPFDPLGIEPVYFRPFVGVIFFIQWYLWGNNVWGYHLVNILLHSLVAVLIYVLLRRMQLRWWAAWFGAAYFAAIPANAATAIYIAELSDALVAISVISGLLSLNNYHRTGKARWLILLNVAFVCAVCSKEVGITLAMLAPLYWLSLRLGNQISTIELSPAAEESIAGIARHWLREALLVWQTLIAEMKRKQLLLIIGPLWLLLIGYLVYRGLVLPTGMLGARYSQSNLVRSLLSSIYWTFKGVPWEVSSWSILLLVSAFGLTFLLQPRSSSWRLVGLGFAWVVVCCIPLSYVGQVEPRLLYVVEIGVAIMMGGVITIIADAITMARKTPSFWRRIATNLVLVVMVVLVGLTGVALVDAQNQFEPGSPKVLQADYSIWTNLKTRSRYPAHNLKIVEQHLRDAHMIDDTTP